LNLTPSNLQSEIPIFSKIENFKVSMSTHPVIHLLRSCNSLSAISHQRSAFCLPLSAYCFLLLTPHSLLLATCYNPSAVTFSTKFRQHQRPEPAFFSKVNLQLWPWIFLYCFSCFLRIYPNDTYGSVSNPCSLKWGSKTKAVLISKVRIISKLTQSTRLRFRLDAERRTLTADRCISERTNSIFTKGTTSL
jgi:hypothetical protein